jgi:hypothetical protein
VCVHSDLFKAIPERIFKCGQTLLNWDKIRELYYSMEQCPSWEVDSCSAIMEHEDSLPCSEEPAIEPYTEPDESNPHLQNLFP